MIGCGRRGHPRPLKEITRACRKELEAPMAERDWVVYIVECADATLYAGVTTDAEARVATHNEGLGAKYTRTRRPVELVYLEPAPDRGAAQKREHEIKRMSAAEKRSLIAGAKGKEAPP